MNLEQLKQMRAALLEKADALRARCAAANQPMTSEETAEFRGYLDQCDALSEQIQQQERLDAAMEQTRAKQERPGAPAKVHDRAEDAPFESFGHYLRSIQDHATSRGHMYDPRLRRLDIQDMQVRAAAGLNEEVASQGGFLVGTDMGTELQRVAFQESQVWSRARNFNITSNSNGLKLPSVDETSRANGSRWGGVQVYLQNEASATTATKPKFGQLEFTLKKLFGLVYMTDELMQDVSVMATYVQVAFGEEFGFKLDDLALRGTGAGAPLGILNSSATTSVSKEGSQAAATILYTNVSKMRARMLPRSFGNAVWFVNVNCMPQIEQLVIPVKNVAGSENVGGLPVFTQDATGATAGNLLGRPIIPIEQCETVGTVGDIILADMSKYLTIAKGGLQQASSIHVNFLTDEMAFRFIMRIDGQPAYKSAITPFKGSDTLGAFVTLATRA